MMRTAIVKYNNERALIGFSLPNRTSGKTAITSRLAPSFPVNDKIHFYAAQKIAFLLHKFNLPDEVFRKPHNGFVSAFIHTCSSKESESRFAIGQCGTTVG